MPEHADVTFRRLTSFDEIDVVAPLWQALQAHHLSLGTVPIEGRTPEDSWARRRRVYEELWSDHAEVWLAQRSGRPVGYALTRESGGWATWAVDRHAELETLIVLPEERGSGIGEALVDRALASLRERGVEHVAVGHIEGNDRTAAFYARLGFEPLERVLHLQLGEGRRTADPNRAAAE